MVLNRLNDVAHLDGLEELLGHHDVEVVEGHEEVVEVALTLLEGGGVAECTLVVRNGPLRGAHDSQVVVEVGVETAEEGVLTGETLGGN